ncbi:aspartic peptidase A1 [Pholiota conissans]|uniref:Aspartic peptidase A1 n=1 Tax=Pholiota conissans TaxID=109636 RepID=A0A9P5ZHY7_9AGAR|nr:aspartic peptidase A1 [Pholiota conissans]
MPFTVVVAFLFLAFSVDANPVLITSSPVTLPISRHLNLSSIHNLVHHDQTRARYMKNNVECSEPKLESHVVVNEPVTNSAVQYTASVGVGSPPTYYNLVIDTGSSNTWIGAGTEYVKTSTSVETSDTVSVSYGSGSFSGNEYTDSVTLASNLVVTKQSIGVAALSSGFEDVDGILGIGPVDLTVGTLSPSIESGIPTVTDKLFSNGQISVHSIGISFEPTTVTSTVNGEISWGGTDSSKYTGSIAYIPLTTSSPANLYWGINSSIRYGKSQTILSNTAGIVDTGTTLVLIASDAFKKYKTATGSAADSTTGLLKISSSQYAALSSLYLVTAKGTFELTPNAQIWPRSLNSEIGGSSSSIYLIVADLGHNSGQGLDFIAGMTFLERYYSVYDTANKRVGLATTSYTTATSN